MSRRATPEGGYAIIWVVIALSVIATLAAASASSLVTINDVTRVNTTATMLKTVAAGIDSFNVDLGAPRVTPNNLTLLTTAVVSGSRAGCSTANYAGAHVTQWTLHAPYSPYVMPSTGLWTPIGQINNLPSRTAATAGTQRTATSDPYFIQISNVDSTLAHMLDLVVDGTSSGSAGTVRYTASAADGTVLLSYLVTFTGPAPC